MAWSGQAGASGGKQGWDDVDTNKDGNISKDEAASNPGLSQVFGQADGNADGSLTKEEYKAFVSKNYGESAKPSNPLDNLDPKQILAQVDANKDGKVSQEELPEKFRDKFQFIDTNADGFVSEQELTVVLQFIKNSQKK